jgi:hypothetical protein
MNKKTVNKIQTNHTNKVNRQIIILTNSHLPSFRNRRILNIFVANLKRMFL